MRRPRHAFRALCLALAIATAALLGVGCASAGSPERLQAAEAPRPSASAPADRMIIRTAELSVTVEQVAQAAKSAEAIAKKAGGYVETSIVSGQTEAHVRMRVASDRLGAALDELAALGSEESRYVRSRDVTGEVIDTRAALRNKKALRDRLRKLLDRAESVKDVLLIEEQLARIQTEIDASEGRLKSLQGQIRLARVDLTLERKVILGPLGLAFKGIVWVIEKLFVIQS